MGHIDWNLLPLSRTTTDRNAHRRQDPGLIENLLNSDNTRIILNAHGAVALKSATNALIYLHPADLPTLPPNPLWLYLGDDKNHSYLALNLTEPTEPYTWQSLRTIGSTLNAQDAGLATTATALIAWHAAHQHCPRCGTATITTHSGWVRQCPNDSSEHYPRTDPAVIMAVIDATDRILLAHSPQWPENRYSTLAGYVEPGEPLEAAVRREVAEEVGITIGNVTYRGSQPWPFPASLMLGYTAQALTTTITVDGDEVTHAQWFTRNQLHDALAAATITLPSQASIARALIEEWYGSQLQD